MDFHSRPRIPRFYAYLAISALLNLAACALLLLPEFLKQEHWSSQRIGWAIGVFSLVNLVFLIVSGRWGERFGNVPTALAGVASATLGGILYLLALSIPALVFPARILHGAGSATVYTCALLQLTHAAPPRLKGLMMGYFGLPGFIMIGIGPLLAEWLIQLWDFRAMFVLVLVSFLLTGVIVLHLPRPVRPGGTAREPFLRTVRQAIPGLTSILLFSGCFGFCYSIWPSFLAPAVAAVGVGAVSSFGIGYALGGTCTRLGMSHILSGRRRQFLAISTLFAYGVGLWLIPIAAPAWQLLVVGLVCGLTHGLFYPSLSTMATERFHPLYPGSSMGLYIASMSTGAFLGSPLWGAIADRTGYPAAFAICGVTLMVSTTAFLVGEKYFVRVVPHSSAERDGLLSSTAGPKAEADAGESLPFQ